MTISTYPYGTPARPGRQNNMVKLGKWVAAQAALGHISFDGVEKLYRDTGQTWPTSKVQASKLRAFYHYGKKHGAAGVLWLEGWKEHRLPGKSTYDTLLFEVRQQL